MTTRRDFIQKGCAGILAASFLPSGLAGAVGQAVRPERDSETFKLGIAGYSFRYFNLDESLSMMRRMDVKYLCIKDFHLPLDSTAAQIAAFHQKLSDAGVTGYAVGPIYTKTREDIDKAFDYAKRVGVKLIVGIPQHEDLAYLSEKVKQHDIRYAIHNHGPEDKLYPNATVINDLVKHLDPRLGMCFDMGHNMRDGQDPIADLRRYSSRIFDLHLKNVTAAEASGKTCELGRGVINTPAFVKMLRKVKYSGCCSLEFEKDMKDPLAGIAESVGYFRGVLDATRG